MPARLHGVSRDGPVPVSAPATDDVHGLFTDLPPAVYSGLRTYDESRFLRLGDHLARTEKSMALSGWQKTLDRDALCRALDVLARDGAGDKRIRFDVLEQPHAGFDLYIGIGPLAPVPEAVLVSGACVAVARGLRRPQPLVKTTDFVKVRRRCIERDPAAYEHVMIDEDERLLECVSSNIYGVRHGVIHTAARGVLEGVTRRIVLELALERGIETRDEGVLLADVAALDEAFLTSSTREVVPVTRIGGAVVGDGRPGPLSRALLAAYRSYAAEHAVLAHNSPH